MESLYFSESQVRLLLCRPQHVAGDRALWECGCSARRASTARFALMPCARHAPLLREVREADDAYAFPALCTPR